MANADFGNYGYRPEDVRSFGPEDMEAMRDDEELEDLEASLDGGEDNTEDTEMANEAYDTETLDEDNEALDTEDVGFEGIGDETFGESEPEHDESISTARYMAERRARDAQMRADGRLKAAQLLDRSTSQIAANVQRKLDQQLSRIPQPPPVRMDPVGTLRGSGVFTAQLENGRRTRLMLTPVPASQVDVNRLSGRINVNHARQAKAIRIQTITLARLKAAQSTASKLHQAELLKVSKDLNKRITDGDTGLDKRIAKEVDSQRKLATKQDTQILRRLGQRHNVTLGHTSVLVGTLPLVAAFGERAVGSNANPITATNAILLGSTIGWMASNNLVSHLARDSKVWRGVSKFWPYAAALGNAGTVWLALRGAAHNDLISGVATGINDTALANRTVKVKLQPHMGKRYFDTFKGFTSPRVVVGLKNLTLTPAVAAVAAAAGAPAVAAVAGGSAPTLVARVADGELTIEAIGGEKFTCEVAWMVETRNPTDQISSSST